MIVTITDDAGNDFILAAGGRESPADWKCEERRSIQKATGLRWTSVKVFDRGNIETSISFSITRLHATIAEAEQFMLDHGEAVPRSGVIKFEGEGDGAGMRQIAASAIEAVPSEYTGVTTKHSYSIIGGRVTEP